jgi:ornithine cyclodeaminase
MSEAIVAMELAFGDDIEVPVRVRLGPSHFMPGWVEGFSGIKVVSTVPGNPVGLVAAFDSEGDPLGIVDGPTLTAIRTGAGAGLATRILARPDSRTVAMLGAGAMAADQVAAMREVRPIDDVIVWSRTTKRSERLSWLVDGTPVTDAAAAVAAADIVCTATPSRAALFDPAVMRPGTHINAVGAFTPDMVEIPAGVIERARVFVDDREAAAVEAGDLIQAGREPEGSIADLLAGRVDGRSSHDDITMFKSVGIASQDVAAAVRALQLAREKGLGIDLPAPRVTPPSDR